MAKHVLITGGAGYIGCVLAQRLLEAGYRVTVLDSLCYGQSPLFHLCAEPRFDFVRGDVRDERLMKGLLTGVDIVAPLAAIVGAPACERDPLQAESVNLDSIRLLLRLRGRNQLVVYPVTNSGYGVTTGQVHCTEETPMNPVSVYGRTKVQAEQLLLQEENVITLRLATVFGMSPRMRIDLLVNHFVYAAVTDGYLVVFEKDFKRNFVHVRDVADCFLHCFENASHMTGRPYNVGLDSANLSKQELAGKIAARVPGFHVFFSELRSDPDKRNYVVSNERLRQAGFEAKRNLEAGIDEMVKGFRMLPRGPFANV